MTQSLAIWLVVALMVVLANLPFATERVFAIWQWRQGAAVKPFAIRLLELLVGYGVVVAIGFAFESRLGNRFDQAWEFYAITLTLYLVCGYPGFVWRYLRRQRQNSRQPA